MSAFDIYGVYRRGGGSGGGLLASIFEKSSKPEVESFTGAVIAVRSEPSSSERIHNTHSVSVIGTPGADGKSDSFSLNYWDSKTGYVTDIGVSHTPVTTRDATFSESWLSAADGSPGYGKINGNGKTHIYGEATQSAHVQFSTNMDKWHYDAGRRTHEGLDQKLQAIVPLLPPGQRAEFQKIADFAAEIYPGLMAASHLNESFSNKANRKVFDETIGNKYGSANRALEKLGEMVGDFSERYAMAAMSVVNDEAKPGDLAIMNAARAFVEKPEAVAQVPKPQQSAFTQ
jgi:hypothetical protein